MNDLGSSTYMCIQIWKESCVCVCVCVSLTCLKENKGRPKSPSILIKLAGGIMPPWLNIEVPTASPFTQRMCHTGYEKVKFCTGSQK